MKWLFFLFCLSFCFSIQAQELVGYTYGYDSGSGKEKIIMHELNLSENNTFTYQNNESGNSECQSVYAGKWQKKKNTIEITFFEGETERIQYFKKQNLYLWIKENQELTLYRKSKPEIKTTQPKENKSSNFMVSESKEKQGKKEKARKEPDCPRF